MATPKKIEPLKLQITAPKSRSRKTSKPAPPETEEETKPVPGVLGNYKHEIFVQALVLGASQRKAYRAAYGDEMTDASADTSASDLLSKVEVADRLRQLQGMSAGRRVLTMQQKREFLHDVVTTPIQQLMKDWNDADKMSPLLQSFSRSDGENTSSTKFTMPDKLRAIELDSKLAGELEPDDDKSAALLGASMLTLARVVQSIALGGVALRDEKVVEATEIEV